MQPPQRFGISELKADKISRTAISKGKSLKVFQSWEGFGNEFAAHKSTFVEDDGEGEPTTVQHVLNCDWSLAKDKRRP